MLQSESIGFVASFSCRFVPLLLQPTANLPPVCLPASLLVGGSVDLLVCLGTADNGGAISPEQNVTLQDNQRESPEVTETERKQSFRGR